MIRSKRICSKLLPSESILCSDWSDIPVCRVQIVLHSNFVRNILENRIDSWITRSVLWIESNHDRSVSSQSERKRFSVTGLVPDLYYALRLSDRTSTTKAEILRMNIFNACRVILTAKQGVERELVRSPVAVEAVQRVCPMTRGQPTAEVTNIQRAVFAEVSLLQEHWKRLLGSKEVLVNVIRHLKHEYLDRKDVKAVSPSILG